MDQKSQLFADNCHVDYVSSSVGRRGVVHQWKEEKTSMVGVWLDGTTRFLQTQGFSSQGNQGKSLIREKTFENQGKIVFSLLQFDAVVVHLT